MRIPFFCLQIVISSAVCAQVKPPDTTSGVFMEWYNIIQANKDLNFIGFGPWQVNGSGAIPPLFEAQIRQPFLLMKGRDNQRPWKRALAVNFNLGFNLRMYQGPGNESYPVRPLNFMAPGISVDYLLNHFFRSLQNVALQDSSKIMNYFNLQLLVSHYSNGQSGSFYNTDSSTTNKLDGNFSTNFFKSQISWSSYFRNASLLTSSLAWTHDFGIGNVLGIEEGLNNSYGFNKLSAVFQLKTGNTHVGKYWYRAASYKKDSGDVTKIVTQVKRLENYNRYASFLVRIEGGVILDKVANYPTFKSPSSEKLRGNIRVTLGYYPANMRTLGLFAFVYYGRDYYNIRYTDKLLNIKAGILFDIQKHIPPNTKYIEQNTIKMDKNP